jgi:hypothetical protein
MVRIALRNDLSGSPLPSAASSPVLSGEGAAVRIHPLDAPPAPPPDTSAAEERERRSHVRRWAAMMIVHLERSEHEHARHYGYVEALERLQALIERELESARAE